MAEAVRKNHPPAVSPEGQGCFFRLQWLPAHINPEWHKLCEGSSSGASSQTLSELSHPAAETSPRSAGLVAGRPGLQPHPISHTPAEEVDTLSPPPLLGFKQCGMPRGVGWATSFLILII